MHTNLPVDALSFLYGALSHMDNEVAVPAIELLNQLVSWAKQNQENQMRMLRWLEHGSTIEIREIAETVTGKSYWLGKSYWVNDAFTDSVDAIDGAWLTYKWYKSNFEKESE